MTEFNLEALVGQGPLGQVYRGRVAGDPTIPDGQVVAIKILHRVIADDERAVAALRILAPQVQALRHPNIVRVHRLEAEAAGARIISELVDGPDLLRLLGSGGPPPPRVAGWVMRDVFAALAALHAAGTVHGDLKLENVLVATDAEGRAGARLTDVGLAAALTLVVPGVPRAQPARAPEVIDGHLPGPAADMFAAGAIFHVLCTGQPPRFAEGALVDLAGIPSALQSLVVGLLAAAPGARPTAVDAEHVVQVFLPSLPAEHPAGHPAGPAGTPLPPAAPVPPMPPGEDPTTRLRTTGPTPAPPPAPPPPPVPVGGGTSDPTTVITRTGPVPAAPLAASAAGAPAPTTTPNDPRRWALTTPSDVGDNPPPLEGRGQRRRGGAAVLVVLALVAVIAAVIAVLITRDSTDNPASPVITAASTASVPDTTVSSAPATAPTTPPSTAPASTEPAPPPVVPVAPVAPHAVGYWVVSSQGAVIPLGDALSTDARPDARSPRVVAATAVPTGGGFWVLYSEGTLRWFGDAFPGDLPDDAQGKQFASLSATPTGQGLYVAAADGTVYGFGDARAPGGTAPVLAAPIVAVVSSPTGQGFWIVGRDGGVLAYGDAPFLGSVPSIGSRSTIVAMARTPSGQGYWLVGNDGGVFSFGDAGFYGSVPLLGIQAQSAIVSLVATPSGLGYWMLGADGGIFSFGDAEGAYFQSAVGQLNAGDSAVALVPRVISS